MERCASMLADIAARFDSANARYWQGLLIGQWFRRRLPDMVANHEVSRRRRRRWRARES